MKLSELRKVGLDILKGTDLPGLDRDLILSYLLGKDRVYLISHGDEKTDETTVQRYIELLEERRMGRPVAYITGEKEFMGLRFYVDENVLIPRPDTEILTEEVLRILKDEYTEVKNPKVLDMCSGSGAIGISLAVLNKNTCVTLSDISPEALAVSEKNASGNGVSGKITFSQGDLFGSLEKGSKFDIIVSNPPYIRREDIGNLQKDVRDYEPIGALDGGSDGLDFYRRITSDSVSFLNPHGHLAFEVGHDQAEEVKSMMEEKGFTDTKIIKDLSGIKRAVSGRLKE